MSVDTGYLGPVGGESHERATGVTGHTSGKVSGEHIRVLIADDHIVVRNGIRFFLEAFDDIEVVGEAANGEEAVQLAITHHPDVILMDVMMPKVSGIEAIRRLREHEPGIRILALTSFLEGELVQEALEAGATGYITKDMEAAELVKSVRLAYLGMPTLTPAAAQSLVHSVTAHRAPRLGDDLTDREREVLALLVEGLTNLDIAGRLIITPATVKFHLRSIRSKLGTSTRTETVVLALQHHLVERRRHE